MQDNSSIAPLPFQLEMGCERAAPCRLNGGEKLHAVPSDKEGTDDFTGSDFPRTYSTVLPALFYKSKMQADTASMVKTQMTKHRELKR